MKTADPILEKMRVYFQQKNAHVVVRRVNNGYSVLHESGEPIARFRPTAPDSSHFEVLCHTNGLFGGLFTDIDAALDYVYTDPMQLFWHHQPLSQLANVTRNDNIAGWMNRLRKLLR